MKPEEPIGEEGTRKKTKKTTEKPETKKTEKTESQKNQSRDLTLTDEARRTNWGGRNLKKHTELKNLKGCLKLCGRK